MFLLFRLLIPNIVLVQEINRAVCRTVWRWRVTVTGYRSTRAPNPADCQTKAVEALLDEVSHEGCMSGGR